MPRHAYQLALVRADLAADAVGIAYGYVEEVALSGGLVVGYGPLDHVAEVVEFVAQLLDLLPALGARPLVRMVGVHRAGGVEVSVGLLRRGHDHQHAVDVALELLVGICLEEVARTLDSLVDVGVVERISRDLVVGTGVRRHLEVAVAARLLALREGKGYGHLAAGLETLPPERVGHLDRGEWYGRYGISRRGVVMLTLCVARNPRKDAQRRHKGNCAVHMIVCFMLLRVRSDSFKRLRPCVFTQRYKKWGYQKRVYLF